MSRIHSNSIRSSRQARGWTQQEIATRAGISRAAVSAIEQQRLTPSVQTAIALARALDTTVERLFGDPATSPAAQWAWDPTGRSTCYWQAHIGDRIWRYPSEVTQMGVVQHHGVWGATSRKNCDAGDQGLDGDQSQRTLVIATCDPAVGLLAAEYARQTPFQMIPLSRASRTALDLMRSGKVHAAGVHLSSDRLQGGNDRIVREEFGAGIRLLRAGTWDAGVALAPGLRIRSARQAVDSRLRWVGREAGSGAHQCLQQLFEGRRLPKRCASHHRGVAMAIRDGWADAGVCLRLTGEENGLGFLKLRRESYDLCFRPDFADDPRLRSLVEVVRSDRYRKLINDLPGYHAKTAGALRSC